MENRGILRIREIIGTPETLIRDLKRVRLVLNPKRIHNHIPRLKGIGRNSRAVRAGHLEP